MLTFLKELIYCLSVHIIMNQTRTLLPDNGKLAWSNRTVTTKIGLTLKGVWKKLLSEIGDAIAVDWFCMAKHPNTDCILRVESVVTAEDLIWKWLIDKDNAFVFSTDGAGCIM